MSRRQQPGRRTSGTSRPKRGVTGPTPAQLAAGMVDAVAADLADEDPLQAQMVASYLVGDRLDQYWDDLGAAADAAEGEDDPEDVPRPALALVRLLGELRDSDAVLRDPALALALALASLDPDDEDVQDATVEVVRKLRFLGAKLPPWAEQIFEPELLGAWCMRDVYSDALTIYVGTRLGDAPAHCVAARIEQSGVAELVDVFVSEGPDVLIPQVEQDLSSDDRMALLRFEELPLARAGSVLWDVIAGVEESLGEQLDDEALDAFALLESRAMLLGPAMDEASDEETSASPHRSELDDMSMTKLAAHFLASHAYTSTNGTHDELAEVVVEWATGTIAEGVARFSPNLALDLLADLAEAAEGDAERDALVEHGIPTARAWARLCAYETSLPDEALAEIERVLDDAAGDFERLVREGPISDTGLTDQLMELMLADGVDVGDQGALDTWSGAWNALSDDERMERLQSLE